MTHNCKRCKHVAYQDWRYFSYGDHYFDFETWDCRKNPSMADSPKFPFYSTDCVDFEKKKVVTGSVNNLDIP